MVASALSDYLRVCAGLVLLTWASLAASKLNAAAPADGIDIELAVTSPKTLMAESILRDLLARYDLRAYAFTKKVRIETGVIPRSHPVLTLNTRSLDDPERWLAQYLHEQIHWFLSARYPSVRQAIAAFEERYPSLPTERGQIARSPHSTYLHLAVNWLELMALRHHLGAARAEEILSTQPFYRWIYATVIRDEAAIAEIMRRHDLVIVPTAD